MANLAFPALTVLVHSLHDSHKYVKMGEWFGWDPEIFLGEELEGKVFGIIGLGKIGKAVAKRAEGFGLKIIFYNRNKTESGYRHVELQYLLENSDYISIHVPLNNETKNMINKETFERMKKKPILINMARGAIVNTEDLLFALKSGKIRGACLDVTNPEPINSDHPLCSMKNCIITPHIGTSTKECREKMAEIAAKNIINHFRIIK